MKVFVTGGSGFVGGHVIEALAGEHEVFAMARSEASARKVAAFGATPVRASLDDIGADQLAGFDAVVHAAAHVEDWGPEAAFRQANVEGTRRMLAAARQAGVARFVQISTNATVLDGTDMTGVDETRPYPARSPFPYAKTKAEAEQLVLDAHDEEMATIALRPCFIWGPRDNTVLPSVQRIVAQGGFAWLDGGRALVSTTHVHNLVAAVRRGLETRVTGAFFVADEDDVTMKEFLGGLAGTVGLDLPARSLPGGVARIAACTLDGLWQGLGRTSPPPLTPMAAELSSRSMTVVTDRARRELGWQPVVSRQAGLAQLATT